QVPLHPLFCSPTRPVPPDLYPLSLHDALPICDGSKQLPYPGCIGVPVRIGDENTADAVQLVVHLCQDSGTAFRLQASRHRQIIRSEEHTSELQSLTNLVCRLLLEKKNNTHASA